LAVGPARGAPPAKGDGLTTVTYDVADLVKGAPAWRRYLPLPSLPVAPDRGADGAEALVQVLLGTVSPESWRPGRDGGSSLQAFNGTRLEVRATRKQHAEIRSLLEALRRMA